MPKIPTLLIKLSLFIFMVACSSSPKVVSEEEVTDDASTAEAADQRTIMDFQFPLKDYKRLVRGFKKKHKGIDISADKGTPIYAAESGWVIYQGRKFKGFGKLMIVEHSKTWATFYAHLNNYGAEQGQWVNKGDIIGYVGRTGRSTGYHLHFEVRRNHIPIDPMIYFDSQRLKLSTSQ